MGKSTISMVIFNSYVKLPEGISIVVPTCSNIRDAWIASRGAATAIVAAGRGICSWVGAAIRISMGMISKPSEKLDDKDNGLMGMY